MRSPADESQRVGDEDTARKLRREERGRHEQHTGDKFRSDTLSTTSDPKSLSSQLPEEKIGKILEATALRKGIFLSPPRQSRSPCLGCDLENVQLLRRLFGNAASLLLCHPV